MERIKILLFLIASLWATSSADQYTRQYTVVNDYVIETTGGGGNQIETSRAQSNVHIMDILPSPNNRQEQVWSVINSMNSYKNPPLYSSGIQPVLKNFKYLIQPIWWSDQDSTDPSLTMNPNGMNEIMNKNLQYYIEMSWGQMEVTYEILPQRMFTISSASPNFGDTDAALRSMIDSLGYVKNVDYNGLVLVYFTSQSGPFSGGGGWASVNGDFMWMSYQLNFAVTRHEAGHNFGHPHHSRNAYSYRQSRPGVPSGIYDGFDMMSGGNGYAVSHFAVASKWFFNWVPDSSIILMQPEGATNECPSCLSTGTFTLKPFDSDLIPSPNDKMGIHIPITTIGNTIYSYWFSYRSGVDGKAEKGLSVHISWFQLGGYFGASYDSLNYDAFGDTSSPIDSFVVEGTCYHVSPAAYVKDRDLVNSEAVQPIVCVDSINIGVDITVSVSFLDPSNPPPEQNDMVKQIFECAVSGASLSLPDLDPTSYNLLHVKGTGKDGVVMLSMCPEGQSTSASAYFHDNYPYSLIHYDSEPSYGSFLSLTSSTLACCTEGTILESFGGTVVKVTNMNNDFLHLNEIEIYDGQGNNVALNGRCFSRNTGWGGDPDCLNDGLTGITSETCISHSSGTNPQNYDFCVLDSPVDIKRIKIYPRYEHTDRLRNLKVEVFDAVLGVENIEDRFNAENVEFLGSLASYSLVNVFTSSQTGPHEEQTTLLTEFPCPNTDASAPSATYQSDYGEAWILIPPTENAANKISVELSCSLTQCTYNEYMKDGKCEKCPSASWSEPGSTSVDDCQNCPGGSELLHPQANGCSLSENYQEITQSKGWRIWAPDFHTESGWAWDVAELQFFVSQDCEGTPIDPSSGTPINSGNAGGGWGPENAFGLGGIWGGRPNDDLFWLGKMFDSNVQVRCVKIQQANGSGKAATEVRIQAYNEEEDRWQNAWIEKNLDVTPNSVNIIDISYVETSSPTASPVSDPTSPPTPSPVSSCEMLELDLTTDKYGSETSWELQDSNSNAIVISGGPYNSNSQFTINQCILPGSYKFIMKDGYGDGICCSYGTGSYELKLNDQLIHSGGEFGTMEVTNFQAPLVPCASFEVEVKTDVYFRETSWDLKNSDNNVLLSGGGYKSSNSVHTAKECINPGTYIFSIYDSYGDGICCGYGSGYFKLKLNGVEFHDGGEFTSQDVVTFRASLDNAVVTNVNHSTNRNSGLRKNKKKPSVAEAQLET